MLTMLMCTKRMQNAIEKKGGDDEAQLSVVFVFQLDELWSSMAFKRI